MCSIVSSFKIDKLKTLITLNQHRGSSAYSLAKYNLKNNTLTIMKQGVGLFPTKVLAYEKETLEAQAKATQAEPANLKSSEELDNFKDEYPDVYGVVETVAKKQADSRVSKLESEIQGLKQKEQDLVRDGAQTELLSVHPDFLDIKDTDEFNAWLSDQPTSISDGITKNGTDAKWAVRVLDLYKSDTGNASTTSKPDLKSAAQAVTKTKPVQYSAKAGNKKTWKQSEIRKLKPGEFEILEKEIDLAAKEGRVSAD